MRDMKLLGSAVEMGIIQGYAEDSIWDKLLTQAQHGKNNI